MLYYNYICCNHPSTPHPPTLTFVMYPAHIGSPPAGPIVTPSRLPAETWGWR